MNYGSIPSFDEGKSTAGLKIRMIANLILKNKWLLLGIMSGFLIATFIFNTVTARIYETKTVIKKEIDTYKNPDDPLRQIVEMRTTDEVETEVRIITSRSVLEKTVGELQLYATINSLTHPFFSREINDISLFEYQSSLSKIKSEKLPSIVISAFAPQLFFETAVFTLEYTGDGKVLLFSEFSDEPLATATASSRMRFTLPDALLSVEWEKPVNYTTIVFTLENPDNVIKRLAKQIDVSALKNTSIFEVAVRSESPFLAQQIANTLIKNFREIRLAQKQQIIRDSYSLVEDQLEKVSENLKKEEQSLSNFMSENEIVGLTESSREILTLMSSIEAEKIDTELQLSENTARYAALKQQLTEKGYFDQTYLGPNNRAENQNTPFSELLRKLSTAELARLELLQKRTENHPDVLAVNQQIEELKRNLTNFNQSTISAYEVIILSLTEKKNNLDKMLAEYSKKVASLPIQQKQLVDIQRRKSAYEKMFNLLMDKREEMKIAELSKLQDIMVVDPAFYPMEAKLPRKKLNLLIAGMLGFMLSIGIIFFRAYINPSVQDLTELEAASHLPIMAIFPNYNRDIRKQLGRGFSINYHFPVISESQYGFRESYRIMQARLKNMLPDRNVILFTSCEPSTGKTTIANHFAVSLALSGKKILVIDCDLKRPRTGKFYNLKTDEPGLIQFLSNGIVEPAIHHHAFDEQDNYVHVIPAGGFVDNSSELLSNEKFSEYIHSISGEYDYVLIDTPPTNWTADTLVLGQIVKDVILVIQPGLTNRDALFKTLQEFSSFNINIVGSVINRCDLNMLADRYRYGYGGNYYYPYGSEPTLMKALPGPRNSS